jgi:hypothetical protein
MFDVHFITLSLRYSSSYYSNFCALSLLRGQSIKIFRFLQQARSIILLWTDEN